MSFPLKEKRVYDPPAVDDGMRILVDRLWPRGLAKSKAALSLWMKDIAPSAELREWFAHDPARWEEFQRRYYAELDSNQTVVAHLRGLIAEGPVSLLYATHDPARNNARALAAYIQEKESGSAARGQMRGRHSE